MSHEDAPSTTDTNTTTTTTTSPAARHTTRHAKVHWPAEWEHHQATILTYPHNPKTFRRPAAHTQFGQVVQALLDPGQERVIVIAPDAAQIESNLRDQWASQQHGTVQIVTVPTNDSWARDTAPTFVVVQEEENNNKEAISRQPRQQRLVGLDWNFNAYGGPTEGCYWPCDLDQQLASQLCQHLKVERNPISLILEGGAIHTDGCGTILTTEECLLNANRNPTCTKDEIEHIVLQATGCAKMIWLPYGLAHDDDTNGHVDNFACFVKPGHVALAWTDDEEHDAENYRRCREAQQILRNETDATGTPLVVHKLHLPRPLFYTPDVVKELNAAPDVEHTIVAPRVMGEQLAASYINFYIANTAILVPQFGDNVYDARAIQTLQTLFPDRVAVGVPSLEILYGGGNIHCITQQVPQVPQTTA